MGNRLADNVSQGCAGPDEFSHRASVGPGAADFLPARCPLRSRQWWADVEQHASSGSEANTVLSNFNQLSTQQKQDLLNFLRSL
jgi:hypothetical protein